MYAHAKDGTLTVNGRRLYFFKPYDSYRYAPTSNKVLETSCLGLVAESINRIAKRKSLQGHARLNTVNKGHENNNENILNSTHENPLSREPPIEYPLGALRSHRCSDCVRTALAGTFSTSTSSFTLSIFPAASGVC